MANVVDNLPQLQNRIKRDPQTYRDDFALQLRSFDAQYELFRLQPAKDSSDFCKLVQFVSQVAHLYPKSSAYVPKQLCGLMRDHASELDPDLRRTLFGALVLLRNRGQLDARELIELCFHLFSCEDKQLREKLYAHVVNDVRAINRKTTNNQLNRSIQGVLFNVVQGQSTIAAKKSLSVIIELYKKRVWVDSRTVNVIASACFSGITKNVVSAVQFFLGIDEEIDMMEEQEAEARAAPALDRAGKEKGQGVNKRFSKKTRARVRRAEREQKEAKKVRDNSKSTAERKRYEQPRFPAIDLINDTQGFVEKLFRRLKQSKDHFEVRLLMMNLVSRVIGHHRLQLLPLYSYLQGYIQPHQRNVTAILAYLVQSSHDLVPPDELEPIVKLVANNFVTDRSGAEVMAVGLNTIREMLMRVPLISDGQGIDDLVSDLVEYRRFRKDRSVVMAARSLLNALREINPGILQRKLRGKFYDADAKPLEFGASKATDGVDGAELLQELEKEEKEEAELDDEMEGYEEDQDGDAIIGDGNGEEEAESDDEQMAVIHEEEEEEEEQEEEVGEGKEKKKSKRPLSRMQKKEAKEVKAMEEFQSRKRSAPKIPQSERIDSKRILTEEDFLRIRELKRAAALAKKDPFNRRKKDRPEASSQAGRSQAGRSQMGKSMASRTVGTRATGMSIFDNSDDEDEKGPVNPAIMFPGDLEGAVRRKRKALAERLESVYKGREEEAAKSDRTAGMSNMQKEKTTKNYLMTLKSRKVKLKQTLSLRQQQLTLKKHIKTIEKKKKLIQKVRRKGGR